MVFNFMSAHGMLQLSVILWLVGLSVSQTCNGYIGYPGRPGIPGAHGADGKDGLKGEKGDPGEKGVQVTGQRGDPGISGVPGRTGLRGDDGVEGPPGPPGPKGQKGALSEGDSPEQNLVFSYKKNPKTQRVNPDKPINFENSLIKEDNDNLQSDGVFNVTIAGMYYISYHISSSSSACLKIQVGKEEKLKFCDSPGTVLVTAGSVVLPLKIGDAVSVQTTAPSSIVSKDTDCVFTGFLLFPMNV